MKISVRKKNELYHLSNVLFLFLNVDQYFHYPPSVGRSACVFLHMLILFHLKTRSVGCRKSKGSKQGMEQTNCL